jgi:hypothetical protein
VESPSKKRNPSHLDELEHKAPKSSPPCFPQVTHHTTLALAASIFDEKTRTSYFGDKKYYLPPSNPFNS